MVIIESEVPELRKNHVSQLTMIAFASLVIFCSLAQSQAKHSLSQEDYIFKKALKLQDMGNHRQAKILTKSYKNHPLYSYVTYFDLRRRLNRHPSSEVARFLNKEKESYLGVKMRKLWLSRLFKDKRWSQYFNFYDRSLSNETTFACQHLVSAIKIGRGKEFLSQIKNIWLSGKSQPKECNPVFKFLFKDNSFNDEIVLERIGLAMNQREYALARYLSRYLSSEKNKKLYRYWKIARTKPNKFLKSSLRFANSKQNRQLVGYAIQRLSRRDIEKTIYYWNEYSKKMSFPKHEQDIINGLIGLAADRRKNSLSLHYLGLVSKENLTRDIEQGRLRSALTFGAWPELVTWTKNDPIGDVSKLRWLYWRAKALNETGQSPEATKIYRELATNRDYYGFLAADQLSLKYSFKNQPVIIDEEEFNQTLKKTKLGRADKLFKIGRTLSAKREFFFELNKITVREKEIAAKLADTWSWEKGTILALGRADSYNDLNLRFPIEYADLIVENLKPKKYYVVRKGDSLWKISKKTGVSIKNLKSLNRIHKKDLIRPGDRLIVHRNNKNYSINVPYKVKRGDSLWRISNKFGVSVAQLKNWNEIKKNNLLRVNQTLVIKKEDRQQHALSLAEVLAIIRSESAFDTYARSSAKARGLMQIIPSTAKATARKHGISYKKTSQLYIPSKNIDIGIAYLTDLLNKYDGNFAMATAAYNAGPHRVSRWQRKQCGDIQRWIDTIPITETRRYVRRAYFYSKIYQWRLKKVITKLEDIMKNIPPTKLNKKGCEI